MHKQSVVLGYHGCDEEIGRELLQGNVDVLTSTNPYDWLGRGAYFWEGSPKRAIEWANFIKKNPQNHLHGVKKPFVVGAVIELGNVLDLTDEGSLEIIDQAFHNYSENCRQTKFDLPQNAQSHSADDDLTKRFLDCAVINYVHDLRRDAKLLPFDSVRGVFTEGKALFPGSKIMAKTHIQISVLNPAASVVGYFKPRRSE